MDKKDNKLLILMIIGALIIFVIIYFRFKSTIYGVFPPKRTSNDLLAENQEKALEKDTDGDGLADFDERLNYSTSQYLSDGFSDKEEIEAGSDPLDPSNTPLNKKANNNKEGSSIEEKIITSDQQVNAPNELGIVEEEITAQEIRKLLINQGNLREEVVDSFDDKTLKSLYNETKEEFIENENLLNN